MFKCSCVDIFLFENTVKLVAICIVLSKIIQGINIKV